MVYNVLRTEVLLTGTPLEDKYSLTSLPLKELGDVGFSRDNSESDFINHFSGGMVLFQRRGEKIPKAIVIARETAFNETYQGLLHIIEIIKPRKQNGKKTS